MHVTACPARPARRAPSQFVFIFQPNSKDFAAFPAFGDFVPVVGVCLALTRSAGYPFSASVALPVPRRSPAALCLPSFPFACGKYPAISREGSLDPRRRARRGYPWESMQEGEGEEL